MTITTVDGSQITNESIQDIDCDDTIEKTINKGVAFGYAPLDVDSKVPTDNLGTETPDNTNFLRGDRVWSILPQIITSGMYYGNIVVNRGIAHMLNVIPRCVIISNTDGKLYTIIAPGIASYNNGGYSVQIWNSTFFYIPGGTLIPGANQNGKTYYWIGFG